VGSHVAHEPGNVNTLRDVWLQKHRVGLACDEDGTEAVAVVDDALAVAVGEGRRVIAVEVEKVQDAAAVLVVAGAAAAHERELRVEKSQAVEVGDNVVARVLAREAVGAVERVERRKEVGEARAVAHLVQKVVLRGPGIRVAVCVKLGEAGGKLRGDGGVNCRGALGADEGKEVGAQLCRCWRRVRRAGC